MTPAAGGLRVGIIGGGPSGAFCALRLLTRPGHEGGRPQVTIFDRRPFLEYGPRGCNMCAGVISHSLVANLASWGFSVPREVVQREIQGYRLVTRAGSVELSKPPGQTIYSAYRGRGPRWANWPQERSFDGFLLRTAIGAGAEHIPHLVTDVRMGTVPQLALSGGETVEVDVVVAACGVNSPMVRRLAALGFGYRPPPTATACQAEIPLPPDYITEVFGNQIMIFALGLPRIKFAALTPKEQHLTVTLIGERPRLQDLRAFVEHPRVRSLLPARWQMPESFCFCFPRFPIAGARGPAADNLAVVGDAHIARYFKNGIDSAFWTAGRAADALLDGERTGADLRRRYARPARRRFAADNACGHLLFGLHDLISRVPAVMAAHMNAAHRERSLPPPRRRLTSILWHMFTGDAPYAHILRDAFHPSLQWELLAATLRQVAAPATVGDGR